MTKFNCLIYVQCTLKEIKEPIPTQLLAKHDVQSNKIEHNVNIKENTHNSIYIDIYNKKIQDVPMIPCFNSKYLCFLKQLKCFSNQLAKQLSIYFQIQIKLSSTSYICMSFKNNINENKPLLYQIPNKIHRNKIIPLVQKITQLEKRFISSHFTFVQIYKLQRYGQYKMHGIVINVPANVDQIQSILSHLP
jgi:hypothetical protein